MDSVFASFWSNVLPSGVTNIISSNLPSLLSTFLNSIKMYPKALEEREKLKKEMEEEDLEFNSSNKFNEEEFEEEENGEEGDDGNEESIGDLDLDEDLDEDEDEEDLDDEDDWEDSDELEEDLYFECPLDNLDFSQLIHSTLSNLSKNPNWNQMTSQLTPEQIGILQMI